METWRHEDSANLPPITWQYKDSHRCWWSSIVTKVSTSIPDKNDFYQTRWNLKFFEEERYRFEYEVITQFDEPVDQIMIAKEFLNYFNSIALGMAKYLRKDE